MNDNNEDDCLPRVRVTRSDRRDTTERSVISVQCFPAIMPDYDMSVLSVLSRMIRRYVGNY